MIANLDWTAAYDDGKAAFAIGDTVNPFDPMAFDEREAWETGWWTAFDESDMTLTEANSMWERAA